MHSDSYGALCPDCVKCGERKQNVSEPQKPSDGTGFKDDDESQKHLCDFASKITANWFNHLKCHRNSRCPTTQTSSGALKKRRQRLGPVSSVSQRYGYTAKQGD